MNLSRRRIVIAAASFAPLAAFAQTRGEYATLKPEQPVETQGKIEVIEFFWYGCIHCYNLQPPIEAWHKRLPPDVQFRRVPAVFNDRWALDAANYYALEALGLVERLHRPLFDAIHNDRLRTDSAESFNPWLLGKGVDLKKFDDARRSFGVQSKVRRAAQLTLAYRIEGTPAMAVHGRYTVSPDPRRGQDAMLATVDQLIDQVRRQTVKK
jgi:thiol:disulfide interchange protein DsbA